MVCLNKLNKQTINEATTNESGIYKLINTKNSKVYVGSTINLKRRLISHFNSLEGNAHENSYLNRSYNKSKDYFYFEIIEYVPNDNNLLKREQYWMDFYKSFKRVNGYNLSPTAGNNLGYKHSDKQKRNNSLAKRGVFASITEEQARNIKIKLSEGVSIKTISEELNIKYGVVRSIKRGSTWSYLLPELDLSENLKAKLTESDVIEIKKRLKNGEKLKEISELYKVKERTIRAIKNNEIWKRISV